MYTKTEQLVIRVAHVLFCLLSADENVENGTAEVKMKTNKRSPSTVMAPKAKKAKKEKKPPLPIVIE
jgi:hypothetical protein